MGHLPIRRLLTSILLVAVTSGCSSGPPPGASQAPPASPSPSPTAAVSVWNNQAALCRAVLKRYQPRLGGLRPAFAVRRLNRKTVASASRALTRELEHLRDLSPKELQPQFDDVVGSLDRTFDLVRRLDYRFDTPVRKLAFAAETQTQFESNAEISEFIYSTCFISVPALPGALFEAALPTKQDHCGRVFASTERLAVDPGYVSEPAPITFDAQWNINSPELLRDPGPGIRMIDDEAILDFTLPGADNGATLAVLQDLGYTGVVMRKWELPSGQTLNHAVYGFRSPHAAEAYERMLLRSICVYATASWTVDLRLPKGGTTEGVGLQLTKRTAGLFEQVSFVRGQHRHVISLSYTTPPRRHDPIIKFARMAARS